MFEVRGEIGTFAAAVRNVPGLELIDEEELESDQDDKAPVAYLMVPDVRALRDLESLWRRWLRGDLVRGETPWRDVFALLRNLRTWGPEDRVQPAESNLLTEAIFGHGENDPVTLEIELVFRANGAASAQGEGDVGAAVVGLGGRIISRARIDDIAYHALLIDLPVHAVRPIIERSQDSIAGMDPVMHIRPQSIASSIEVSEGAEAEEQPAIGGLGTPILALLDGVPVAAHSAIAAHVVVDDQFDLEPDTPVADRVHGTAMASLIVHGDRNRPEPVLPRRIHVVPVLGAQDQFSRQRLIVDVIYAAVLAMREGAEATAPGVVIVNLSLGNPRRPFHGQLSPWARLLDRLAYRFGLLFIVSAGNYKGSFGVGGFATHQEFEDASVDQRATETLRALGAIVADRRIFSPAETVNGLTIGACNQDAVTPADRVAARVNVDPYGELPMANPSSALGPGFALSVKPDLLMPGSREHLRFARSHPLEVKPADPARSAGLRVAAPPRDGRENLDGYTSGTSAAAALASRTAHRIHDALEGAYGEEYTRLPPAQRAVLLKALLAHPARWPEESASLIRQTIGPPEGQYRARQKDNIRRFLGYGLVDADDAVACAADRATFWVTGVLQPNKVADVAVPLPAVMSGQALPHSLSATLAWFTPIATGRRSYRSVRLQLLKPSDLASLAVKAHGNQPDGNQTRRGTLFTRCWSGDRAPVIGQQNASIQPTVQRDPDQGLAIDEPVPFGLTVTVTMPGVVTIYEQVRQRLGIVPRAPV